MTATWRCPTCHRVTTDGVVTVPGGERRIVGDPNLTAWRVLRRSRQGELPSVVAACSSCGMPAVGEGAPIPWEIDTPAGRLRVTGEGIEGPNGPMSDAEADALVEAQLKTPSPGVLSYAREAVLLAPLSLILLPLAMWVFGLFFLAFFISRALPIYKPW